MTVDKTFITKLDDIKREWFYVDADGQSLGRMASKIAAILRGNRDGPQIACASDDLRSRAGA